MPAAAVTPAPIAYTIIVAVKTFVVGFQCCDVSMYHTAMPVSRQGGLRLERLCDGLPVSYHDEIMVFIASTALL